jgi:hypothetical protein
MIPPLEGVERLIMLLWYYRIPVWRWSAAVDKPLLQQWPVYTLPRRLLCLATR